MSDENELPDPSYSNENRDCAPSYSPTNSFISTVVYGSFIMNFDKIQYQLWNANSEKHNKPEKYV